jgi:hypothetical protein
MKRAIINRTLNYGTLEGVIMENWKIEEIVDKALQNNLAKCVVDTDETLMYIIFN